MAKMKKGMASMPQSEHKQMMQCEMGHECKLKYATEMGNPRDLDKSTEALASYVKKNQMKY